MSINTENVVSVKQYFSMVRDRNYYRSIAQKNNEIKNNKIKIGIITYIKKNRYGKIFGFINKTIYFNTNKNNYRINNKIEYRLIKSSNPKFPYQAVIVDDNKLFNKITNNISLTIHDNKKEIPPSNKYDSSRKSNQQVSQIIEINHSDILHYCKHTAPGGIQNLNSFKNWCPGFIGVDTISHNLNNNDIIEKIKGDRILYDNGRFKECDTRYLVDFVKSNMDNSLNNMLKEKYKVENIETLLYKKMCHKFRQYWMDMTLKKGSYVCLRGKLNDLKEAWIVKIIGDINPQGTERKIKVISRVDNSIYHKIIAKRQSIWKLTEHEIVLLSNELKNM